MIHLTHAFMHYLPLTQYVSFYKIMSDSRRPKKKRSQDGADNNGEELPLDQQILEALKTQTTLLKSIDARLGRIERQEHGTNLRGRSSSRRNPLPKALVAGSWQFSESPEAERQRALQAKGTQSSYSSYVSFGQINGEGLILVGENFSRSEDPSSRLRHPSTLCNMLGNLVDVPNWSNNSERWLLPRVLFNTKGELGQRTGIYSLTVKFNKTDDDAFRFDQSTQDAGIIVGETEFNDKGFVMGEGADWDRLLNGQRQTQLPYAHGARGNPIWLQRKLTEPWEDGDVLKFRIDTNENTIVFQRGNTPEKTLWNVLAFTNNRTYPDFLHVFAYCGSSSTKLKPNIKLTII